MSTTDDTRRRLAEIKGDASAATSGPWKTNGSVITTADGDVLGAFSGGKWDQTNAQFAATARTNVPWLVEQLERYVGMEPTRDEEMAYLGRCLDAVLAVCDQAEKQATRWENPLPVPEWVETVRKAVEGGVA